MSKSLLKVKEIYFKAKQYQIEDFLEQKSYNNYKTQIK